MAGDLRRGQECDAGSRSRPGLPWLRARIPGVIAGVILITSNHTAGQPAVANMSLGGGVSTALDTAVSNSIADGVTYAIAAGNSNANACNSSPARVARCDYEWIDDHHRCAIVVLKFRDLRRYLRSGIKHYFLLEHERHRDQQHLRNVDGHAARSGSCGAVSGNKPRCVTGNCDVGDY